MNCSALRIRHKGMFLPKNDVRGERIDHEAVVSRGLQLIPAGAADAVIAEDYSRMLADGMLLEVSESLDRLMERCALIKVRAKVTKA